MESMTTTSVNSNKYIFHEHLSLCHKVLFDKLTRPGLDYLENNEISVVLSVNEQDWDLSDVYYYRGYLQAFSNPS